MSARYRKLTPTEWAYIAAAHRFPPFAIQLWIEGEGLALEPLRAAVARAAAVNAGARLRARGRWWWIDDDAVPAAHELDGPLTPEHPVLRKPFDVSRAVPCEAILFPGHGVLFRCSHALMDAHGLIFFAMETFRALRGEPLLGSSRAISDRERLHASGHRRRDWPRARSVSPVGPPRRADGFEWATRRFGATPGWLARLQSAIARRSLERSPGGRVQLLVPASLRDDNESRRTTANLAGPLLLDFSSGPDAAGALEISTAALARGDERAVPAITALVPWMPAPLLSWLHDRVHRRCVQHDRYLFTAVVSHIGKVSLAAFNGMGFAARATRLMPFDAPGAALTLVTLEHDGGVELATSAPRATAQDGELTRTLDSLLADEPAAGGP